MGYFADTLKALLEANDMSKTDLAERSGVDRTWISRLLKDRNPTRDQVAALCAGISADSADRARLLVAHLRDEAKEAFERAGIDDRHVKLYSTSDFPNILEESNDPIYGEHWPMKLKTELAVIAQEALRTEEMRALIEQWVAVIERATEERRRKP